jgi:hypothetical protein
MQIKVLTFRRLFISGSKVAKTSQGSSESIKTISIVTLLFLPARELPYAKNPLSLLSKLTLLLIKEDYI